MINIQLATETEGSLCDVCTNRKTGTLEGMHKAVGSSYVVILMANQNRQSKLRE